MVRQSYTAVVERNQTWSGAFATEPYEAAWAGEAIFFVRALEANRMPDGAQARVQISPDGIHWADEGSNLRLPEHAEELKFVRVRHFGGWLRLAGVLAAEAQLKVIVALALKE